MHNGRVLPVRAPFRWQGAVMVALAAGHWACVGSETGERLQDKTSDLSSEAASEPEREPAEAVRLDDVEPVGYQVFEIVPASENPKKVLYRLMVLEQTTQKAMVETVRLALDSLGRADTMLVAARAVLYVFRPTERDRGKLVPVVWGEWVPLEGWETATPDSRTRRHRSYVYSGNPGWNLESTAKED